ncbi:MAG TPA: peroxiredoxin [Patescibacteria group bacterium]|jgi:peroxiredoxin (alkyl hydroperoxide reductase subunit C)|nr:peroxiredoxin [Patescibacteria group bacterium]
MAIPQVGETAPDFTMKDQDGKEVKLSDYRGKKNVLLAFFPLAFTPVCSCQIPQYKEDIQKFNDLNTQVLAVSVDSVPAHKAWTDQMGGINYPVLSDFYPHGDVAKKYGVLREQGFSERALFVIDKKGVVRFSQVHEMKLQPDNSLIIDEIRKLG